MIHRSVLFRILLDTILFVTLINGWWFIALPLLIIGVWRFYFAVEIIVAGVMYDALFGMVQPAGIWGYIGTITAVVILLFITGVKKIVR